MQHAKTVKRKITRMKKNLIECLQIDVKMMIMMMHIIYEYNKEELVRKGTFSVCV